MTAKKGGKRANSGRKPTGRVRVTVSVTVTRPAAENLAAVALKQGLTRSQTAEAAFLAL